MVSGNDPVESLLNSVQAIKESLSPLELSMEKATKDFRFPWMNSKTVSTNPELVTQIDGLNGCGINVQNSKIHPAVLNNENSPLLPTIDEERRKGLSINLSIWGQLLPKSQIAKQMKERDGGNVNGSRLNSLNTHPDHWRSFTNLLEGRRADVKIFLGNLKFARIGGLASTLLGITSSLKEDNDDASSKTVLDRKKLFSVQGFFRYTEAEGRRFFDELDRDGDGKVKLEDLKIAMRKRKLPQRYAREFMKHAKTHLFAKSFGWKQFLTLMEQKEPTILRAYTCLCLTESGTLQKSEILSSLKHAGLPASEENAAAMMKILNADTDGSISYGHFRNFMLLLPSDRLQDDPRNIWLEAASVKPEAQPTEMPLGSVMRSALAGGLAYGLSTSLPHLVDTIKVMSLTRRP